MSEKNFDFVAIGDITTDAFIRLKDADVHCDIHRGRCEICLRFGDKVPYESVTVVPAVGNSPNAACAAARLGLGSALITNLGDDDNGRAAIATLKENGVDTNLVKTHPAKRTNYHYVLWFEDERTILINHEKYDYALPDLAPPKWIYLSSLGETSIPFHQEIADYLKKHPETKLAFQPGTFQIKIGHENIKDIYERVAIFFCNREEAGRILKTEEADIKKLLAGLRRLGPQVAVITDGPKGAYADDGERQWFHPIYPDPKPPFERTGAGDAFASTFTAAVALGKTVPEALSWGPINSMNVVQSVGAQAGLLNRTKLETLLAAAPADYQAQVIN